jgi:hypothetical protein
MKRYRIEVWSSPSENALRVSDAVIRAKCDRAAWREAADWVRRNGFARDPFDFNIERLAEPFRFIASESDCED